MLFAAAPFILGGCARLAAPPLLSAFSASLSYQTDLDLLKDGLPSFLLTIDGLAQTIPDNRDVLLEAARGYAFYAMICEAYGEKDRMTAVGGRAREYGIRLLGLLPRLREAATMPMDDLQAAAADLQQDSVPLLFWGAQAWGTWLRSDSGSVRAAAEMGRVRILMARVLALDESYYFGGAHLFFGAYYGTLPAIAGGSPDKSRFHFEQAKAFGGLRFLMTPVLYAEIYGRATLDKELYATLLGEVLAAPVLAEETAAANALARRKAKWLLAEMESYF